MQTCHAYDLYELSSVQWVR